MYAHVERPILDHFQGAQLVDVCATLIRGLIKTELCLAALNYHTFHVI